jgi:hypothetical protein
MATLEPLSRAAAHGRGVEPDRGRAAALLIACERAVKRHGLKPRAAFITCRCGGRSGLDADRTDPATRHALDGPA